VGVLLSEVEEAEVEEDADGDASAIKKDRAGLLHSDILSQTLFVS
jgi:hypothetical protein